MRLNASMRKYIISHAIAAKFNPMEEKLDKEALATGHALYTHLFGKAKAAIAAVPKVFLRVPSAEEIRVGFTHGSFNLSNGYRVELPVPVTDHLPVGSYHMALGTIKDEALCNRCIAHLRAGEQLNEDRAEARETLKALLSSIGTYASLEREWPEGKKFYASLPSDFPGNTGLPMVQISKLNHLLGLAA